MAKKTSSHKQHIQKKAESDQASVDTQQPRPSQKLLQFLAAQKWEILIFFLLALVLRFFRLTNPDLWMDEVAIFFDALNGTHESVSTAHLFHLKAVGWFLNTFGETAFWFRFWGALAGSLAIPVIYLTAGLLRDKNAARLAAFFLALSPFLIFYSRDGNYYGAMSLFACLQLFFVTLVLNRFYISGIFGLLAVSFLTHINHPFASIFSVFCLGFLFLYFLVSLIKHRHHLVAFLKIRKNQITVLISVILVGFGTYLLYATFSDTLGILRSKLTLGQGLGNIEFTSSFFVSLFSSMLGSYYQPEGLRSMLRLIGLAMVILYIGSIIMLTIQRKKAEILIIVVHAFSLAAALFVIFNLDFRNFNSRYFSFLVPGFFLIISLALPYISAKKRGALFNTVTVTGLLYLIAIAPVLGRYYGTDHGNYRLLAEHLRNQDTDFDQVLFPVSEEMSQARFYFEPHELSRIKQIQSRPQLEQLAITNLKFQAYDREKLVIASAWRHRPMPDFWGFIDDTFAQKFHGNSIHSPSQDAIFYSWDYQDRVLFDHLATTFEISKGESAVLAYEGNWKVQSSAELFPSPFDSAHFSSDKTQRLTVDFDKETKLTILPILPDKLDLGPFNSISYTDDFRNLESTRGDIPVTELAFDGVFSYLVYQPDDQPRHLILKKWNDAPSDEIKNKIGIIYFVSVDGIPVGLFLDSDLEEGFSSIEIDLNLTPGNHRIDLYGTRLRAGDPFHHWVWAGIEWNAGKASNPSTVLREQGVNVFTPDKAIPWEGSIEGEFNADLPETLDVYHRRINTTEQTPSGVTALEYSFASPLNHERSIYTPTLSSAIPVASKSILGYTTHIKGIDNRDYGVSLYTVFFDKNGKQLNGFMGKQQMTIEPLNGDWRRYVELIPVPQEATFATPGVIVYPPNIKSTREIGTVFVDSILPIKPDLNLRSSLYVSDKLFFSTGATPWQPGNQTNQ